MKQINRSSALGTEVAARIPQIWETTRSHAVRTVNLAHVCGNGLIGSEIVEAERGGVGRAESGLRLLEQLSGSLAAGLGSAFAVSSLKYMRLHSTLYPGYPALFPIGHAARDQLAAPPEIASAWTAPRSVWRSIGTHHEPSYRLDASAGRLSLRHPGHDPELSEGTTTAGEQELDL